MVSNSRARLYDATVSWAGREEEENFEWASMIDIELYLSNTRVEYHFILNNLISVLS
jgi:hypothetical protein